MKKVYIVLLILFIIFLCIFISSTSGYYEYSNNKKTVFTEDKIKQFEKDVAEGKNVNINDYLKTESKDYTNNITNIGDGVSEFINDSVNFVLKGGFKIIEKMIN
jgi:archaellum component FlaF (FlaF/FlaG flagellin family)